MDSLALRGSLENIASHCELRSGTGDRFDFVLDSDNAGLFNSGHRDGLRAALEQHFGREVSVTIIKGEVGRTPAMIRAQQRRERHAAAEAELEGDQAAAILFTQIAKIEKHHRDRFKKLLKLVEKQMVYKRDEPIKWKCTICGYVYEGTEPPPRCPYCKYRQEYYEPANLDI
jgi:rubrerythrin